MEENVYAKHAEFIQQYLIDQKLTQKEFFTLLFSMIIETSLTIDLSEETVIAWLKSGFKCREEWKKSQNEK